MTTTKNQLEVRLKLENEATACLVTESQVPKVAMGQCGSQALNAGSSPQDQWEPTTHVTPTLAWVAHGLSVLGGRDFYRIHISAEKTALAPAPDGR